MISDVLHRSSAKGEPLEMAQVVVSLMLIGTLKREWTVRPPFRRREAIPDEATHRTISPFPRKRLQMVLLTNVFPHPPAAYRKKTPSRFAIADSTTAS